MIKILAFIFIILLYIIGRRRAAITLKSLCLNIAVLCISIILMSWGWNPVLVTFPCCLIICYITLFYQNGKNAKTIASFSAVILVLIILFALSCSFGCILHINGVNEIMLNEDEIAMLTPDIDINMSNIAIAVIITGLIGAAMDASIAVSSAVYEVYKNNRNLNKMELFRSGIYVGSDILGATVNTLYFACLGGSFTLFILFKNYHYSLLEVINSKAFCQEFVDILFGCLACTLVVPLTAIFISYILKNPDKYEKYLSDDDFLIELQEQQ